MKPFTFFLVLILLLSVQLFATAPAPITVAEGFLSRYVERIESDQEVREWVAASDLLTPRFKRYYARSMRFESLDSDPVLLAQDTPTQGFRATMPSIDGKKAIIILTGKYGQDDHRLRVVLLLSVKGWQIDSVERER
jgi:hypothetical protein